MTQSDLQRTFVALREECIWLRICFNTYAALYESGEETTQLLRGSPEIFFSDMRRILIEYTYLQACKITDAPEFNGRQNLTVHAMNASLDDAGLLSEEIRTHANGVLRYRRFLTKARNRLIAHLDKRAVLSGQPMGGHDTKEVSAFFEALQEYCDSVGRRIGEGPLDFRTNAGPGDALDLVRVLRKAKTQGRDSDKRV